MSDPRYLQEGFDAQVAHVAEEIGEAMKVLGDIMAAIGKAGRWGWESVNPELEPEDQETNREWLARALRAAGPELDDVNLTIGRLRQTMGEHLEQAADAIIAQRESGEPVAWRRRPKGSDGAWTFSDDPADAKFYAESGRYDIQALRPISQGGAAPCPAHGFASDPCCPNCPAPAEAQARIEAWVLQRNDHPYAVYFNEVEATTACAVEREKERRWREENAHVADVRVFWNVYRVDRGALSGSTPKPAGVEITEEKVAEIVREHFYPGPVTGSTARLAAALTAALSGDV